MRTSSTTVAAAGLALALSLTGCAAAETSAGSGSATPTSASAISSSAAPAADIAFAQLMIPHHAQALDMAAFAEAQASSAEVKALAAQIQAAQDPEIAQMAAWLEQWGAPTAMPGATGAQDMADMDHSGHDMGGMTGAGMMTAEQMDALAQATGAEFDTMWLQLMIAHHEGAIVMARQVLTTTANPEVKALAEAVVKGQTAEIATMKALLEQ